MLDRLLDRFFPARCFLCNRITEGQALCPSCRERWDACVVQGMCEERFSVSLVDSLFTLAPYRYEGTQPVSSFLRRAKRVWRKRAVAFAAGQACQCLQAYPTRVWRDITVVPVPRSLSAVKRFGFDQAKLLAKAMADRLGACYCEGLVHTGSRKQKVLNREKRKENAMASYHINPQAVPFLAGRHLLLVDDVVTTGATASVCASLLREAGALSVDVFALARTYHSYEEKGEFHEKETGH